MSFKNKLILKLLIVLISIVLFIRLINNSEKIDKSELIQIKTQLHTDVKILKGSRHSYYYKFWVTNYSAEFAVDANNLFKNGNDSAQTLKKGDSILIFIKRNDLNIINKKSKRIRVFQIIKNDKEYLKID